MTKYLLTSEKERIHSLITSLSKVLNVSEEELFNIENHMKIILRDTKDASIEDILNKYYSLLESDMRTILDKRITQALQFGIKNDIFSIVGYEGTFNSKPINENTYFSFDSISKVLVSVIIMLLVREKQISLKDTVNSYNQKFNMDASVEDILKFTAMIQTEKRIDNLSKEETIAILKNVRENIKEKSMYKNYYQYNDIGYMILRLSVPDFLDRLDKLLIGIDKNNLTYKNMENIDNITGGKLGEEYITPDPKGRSILLPGHTGMYGNIEGLLNLFNNLFYNDKILTFAEKEILLRQPYTDSVVYTKDGKQMVGKNNSLQYMAKVAGVYRKPLNIKDNNYNKLASCDLSNLTTDMALASAGTCGSWVMGDDLSWSNQFGSYVGGILTNPYSYVNVGKYPDARNMIEGTELMVNQNGVILGYSGKLNHYKEVICEYGILLELLTEYIKSTDMDVTLGKEYKLVKKIQK
ncbi:MAG: serine hydrolase [Bacilli bacterium]|nr:serine hydrolase [Bacilli bacterium]